MRLDMDCLRSILLQVEDKATLDNLVEFPNEFDADVIQHYTVEALAYHINQCYQAGLLIPEDDEHPWDFSLNTLIRDLTPKGHEFLANVRQDTLWNKTKAIAASVGSYSIKAIADIAASVVAAAIQAQLKP